MDSLRPRFHPVYHRYDCGRPRKARNRALKPQVQVLVALRFSQVVAFLRWLATLSVAFLNALSRELSVGCRQPSFESSRSLYGGHPQPLKGKRSVNRGFSEKDGFAGVIGCIDRTDIHIHMTDYCFGRTSMVSFFQQTCFKSLQAAK